MLSLWYSQFTYFTIHNKRSHCPRVITIGEEPHIPELAVKTGLECTSLGPQDLQNVPSARGTALGLSQTLCSCREWPILPGWLTLDDWVSHLSTCSQLWEHIPFYDCWVPAPLPTTWAKVCRCWGEGGTGLLVILFSFLSEGNFNLRSFRFTVKIWKILCG